MASRAVAIRTRTRYVSRPARRRSASRSGKIPLGPILGLVPGVAWAAEPVQQGRTWDETWQRLVAGYTGYSYGEKRWSSFYLTKGLFPLMGGFLAHMIADKVGINRAIARFKLPVEI